MISQAVSEMLGAKYKLGNMSVADGFDCFSYVPWFYRRIGAYVPEASSDGSASLSNYLDAFAKDPEAAKILMWRELRRLTEKVANPNLFVPADLFVIHKRGQDPTTAIYLGAGNMLSCDVRIGIVVFPKVMLRSDKLEVLRPCLKQSR